MIKNIKFIFIFFISSFLFLNLVSCNISFNYKPAFFNYEDYMSDFGVNKFSKNFSYKEFQNLPELENNIESQKASGGISSDYYVATMAKQHLIKKIDFNKLFHTNFTNKNELKKYLKKKYTDVVWQQMSAFDNYLDDKNNHLWEFMVPYFIQKKVLVFNKSRGEWSKAEKDILNNYQSLDFEKAQKEIENKIFPNRSYLGLLKTLKNHKYNNFVNNDYSRDNLMIGSEYNNSFNQKLTNKNYISQIQGFKKTLKEGLNLDLKSENILYETSGNKAFNCLIDPLKKWQCSFLYNGDAECAHFGGGNDDFIDESKNLRFVNPQNPIYLLDGLVISKKCSLELENKIYQSAYEGIYYFSSLNNNDILKSPLFINYKFVGYTPVFKSLIEGIDKINYFSKNDWIGKNLFKINFKKRKTDGIIWPISKKLQAKYLNYYKKETSS